MFVVSYDRWCPEVYCKVSTYDASEQYCMEPNNERSKWFMNMNVSTEPRFMGTLSNREAMVGDALNVQVSNFAHEYYLSELTC